MTINTPWAMILCRFSDIPDINLPKKIFEQFLTKSGEDMGGLYDYWKEISYGSISIDGSKVIGIEFPEYADRIGWFEMPYSFALNGFEGRDFWIDEAKKFGIY